MKSSRNSSGGWQTDLIRGIRLALWSERCPLTAKSSHGFHGCHGFYEGTAKRRCFLQPPGCRQRRRHHLARLDTRMHYAYEFVKSVESVAAFEGAKQLPFGIGIGHRKETGSIEIGTLRGSRLQSVHMGGHKKPSIRRK